MSTSDPTPSAVVPSSRAILATALLLYFGVGPAISGAGVDARPWLVRWHMFKGFGSSTCDVAFWHRQPVGSDVRIDRYALLGLGRWQDVPIEDRKMTRAQLPVAAGPICEALGPTADVRIDARCGTPLAGWQTVERRAVNACAP